MLRTYRLRDCLVLHNYKPEQSYPIIAVDQDTIAVLIDSSQEVLSQWDSAFRQMLGIGEYDKYLIVDMGQSVPNEDETYQVPCLCTSDSLSASIRFDGRVCTV